MSRCVLFPFPAEDPPAGPGPFKFEQRPWWAVIAAFPPFWLELILSVLIQRADEISAASASLWAGPPDSRMDRAFSHVA